MDSIQSLSNFDAINILSDPRRLAILRALMAAPATLTHLGQDLDMHPARVRYHLKLLEDAGLVTLVETRVVGNYTEKYYRAMAKAFNIQVPILPQHAGRDVVIVSGSDDLALEFLASRLSRDERTPAMFALPVGSLDGLVALKQGLCQMAACHLFDPPSGEYNLPYVRHLFPGQEMRVVTLVRRRQGLLISPGNPRNIRGLEDLAPDDIVFINRKRGSGTRLWLDYKLKELHIPVDVIQGYRNTVNTHLEVAESIATGKADVGLAILAAAEKYKLDFVPLFEERYDLVIPKEQAQNPLLAPAFDTIHSSSFRGDVESLAGYDTRETGDEIKIQTI